MKLVPAYNSLRRNYSNMNDMIDSFFKTGFDDTYYDSFKVDVEKEKDAYKVTADLPGIARENINIEMEDNLLTIEVKKDEEKEEQDQEKHFLHRERKVVNTSRSIRLSDIDEDKISAKLEDGVLTVMLPMMEEVSKKKSIDIK